jgi:histone H3/H4
MGHRDAGAVESRSPKFHIPEEKNSITLKIKNPENQKESTMSDADNNILVVVSKTKKYIKDQADFNTASDVMDALTQAILQLCDRAIENAKNDGRKTVLRRDVPKIRL